MHKSNKMLRINQSLIDSFFHFLFYTYVHKLISINIFIQIIIKVIEKRVEQCDTFSSSSAKELDTLASAVSCDSPRCANE